MRDPNLFGVEELVRCAGSNSAKIDGRYVPARPLGFASLRWRLRITWLVFAGKADAVTWPGQ